MQLKSTVIATRGERLALTRVESSNGDPQHGEFGYVMLSITEVDADERIAAVLAFDPDDLDGGLCRTRRALPRRGGGRPFADMVVRDGRLRRLQPSGTAIDNSWLCQVDHRRGAGVATGELFAYLQAAWEDAPGSRIHVEAVHRLSDHGAVVTHAAEGVSREGFDAEWRAISLGMFDRGTLSRTELFDRDDLKAALARFDELSQPSPRLQNAASRAYGRFVTCFERGHWDQMGDMIAADVYPTTADGS